MNSASLCSANISLLYEDDFLFVIEKPADLHSVMLPEGGGPSIAQYLLEAAPYLSEVSSKGEDAGLIHRLDFETSGALLGAKNRDIWMSLRARLLSESISKQYLALCEGEISADLEVENYIGASSRGSSKVKVYKQRPRSNSRALPARTEFKCVNFFPELNVSLLRAIAPSARRHQIRAHASFIKHPLLGDTLYGSKRFSSEVLVSAPKFLLHAESLEFNHPVSNEQIRILAPFKHAVWGQFLKYLCD